MIWRIFDDHPIRRELLFNVNRFDEFSIEFLKNQIRIWIRNEIQLFSRRGSDLAFNSPWKNLSFTIENVYKARIHKFYKNKKLVELASIIDTVDDSLLLLKLRPTTVVFCRQSPLKFHPVLLPKTQIQ